MQQTNS